MGKSLRVAVLYNEPVAGAGKRKKFVSENGHLRDRAAMRKAKAKARRDGELDLVDLSELGVVDSMEGIRSALNTLGYKSTTLNVDSDLFRLIDYLREEKPDMIFNLVECVENESIQEMNVAGIYELMNIPYTGASPLTLGIALNKPRVKEVLSYHGIRTPEFQVFPPGDRIVLDGDLLFPLIVKPSHEDASVGIDDNSVVYNQSGLRKRVQYIFEEFDQAALVEQYVLGRELNVAIIGNTPPIVLPISEIDFSGLAEEMHKIVSYDAKWMHGTIAFNGTNGVCPARLTASQEAKIKDIALRCYRIIGCRDYARIDFRMTDHGALYVLEVNPNPDLSDDAGFARSAMAYGFTFPQMVGTIVESALERC